MEKTEKLLILGLILISSFIFSYFYIFRLADIVGCFLPTEELNVIEEFNSGTIRFCTILEYIRIFSFFILIIGLILCVNYLLVYKKSKKIADKPEIVKTDGLWSYEKAIKKNLHQEDTHKQNT